MRLSPIVAAKVSIFWDPTMLGISSIPITRKSLIGKTIPYSLGLNYVLSHLLSVFSHFCNYVYKLTFLTCEEDPTAVTACVLLLSGEQFEIKTHYH